jgi:hypothetical protein
MADQPHGTRIRRSPTRTQADVGAGLRPVRAGTVRRPARGGWAKAGNLPGPAETGGHHGGDPGPGYATGTAAAMEIVAIGARLLARSGSAKRTGSRERRQRPGPAGCSRWHGSGVRHRQGSGAAPAERLRTARQRCLPQPSPEPLASALPGPSTSTPRGVGSAGGMISSGVCGVVADRSVLAGRSS